MKKQTLASLLALGTMAASANAALWIDFNSNQSGGGTPITGDPANATSALKNETGYQSYQVAHENAAQVNPATAGVYATTFPVTGAASVSVLPNWTNTTNNNVRQSIGRGNANNANWTGPSLNLVEDWLGIDTRAGNGGNGNWDGTTGTPTFMTLTLSGLAAGTYNWTSFHIDTENVHVFFEVAIDTGSGLVALPNGSMTDATATGNPDSDTDGTGLTATDFSALNTYNTSFTSTGADVTLQFAPLSNTAVHSQLWGINGFQLEQVPEPSTGLLGLLGLALVGLRRRR